MKICFVAPDAYAVASGSGGVHAGGAETQQFQFAEKLRSRGYDVRFVIAKPFSIPEANTLDLPSWVRIAYPLRDQRSKTGYIRDSISLFKAMRNTGADIFIQRCSFHDTPRVGLFSKILGASFVFWTGADFNVNHEWMKSNLSGIRRYSFLKALKGADVVICQTVNQQQKLEAYFSLPSTVIRNSVNIPENFSTKEVKKDQLTAIWCGRINSNKQPGKLLELARRNDQWRFTVAALKDRLHPSEYKDFLERARQITNVTVYSSLSHREYLNLTVGANLVLNTSVYEGYPNTLLEAYARGVPSLTLGVDPDNSIEKNSIGWVCSGIDEASATMSELVERPELLADAGKRAFTYVQNSHAAEVVVEELEILLLVLKDEKSE